jgi:hypothetical protein
MLALYTSIHQSFRCAQISCAIPNQILKSAIGYFLSAILWLRLLAQSALWRMKFLGTIQLTNNACYN